MSYKYKDAEAKLQTDNLYVAKLILANPGRYKDGSLMHQWATMIMKQSEDATEK